MTGKELGEQPAFPFIQTDECTVRYDGLTKREHFAGQLLAGLVANPQKTGNIEIRSAETGQLYSVCFETAAVIMADALLVELSKEQK